MKIGISLCGGDCNGAAAAYGFLTAMRDAGMGASFLAATGFAAAGAACYASAMNERDTARLLRRLSDADLVRWSEKAEAEIENRLRSCGVRRLGDFSPPLYFTCADLKSGKQVLFAPERTVTSGDSLVVYRYIKAAAAVRAAVACAGGIAPREFGDRLLCGGCILSASPVWVLRCTGAERVFSLELGDEVPQNDLTARAVGIAAETLKKLSHSTADYVLCAEIPGRFSGLTPEGAIQTGRHLAVDRIGEIAQTL